MKSLASSLLLAALATSLGGCQTTVGLIPPDDLYPTVLTGCADEPQLAVRTDTTKPRSDEERTSYVLGLRSAFFDCKDTVDSWADRKTAYIQRYGMKTSGYFSRVWRSVTSDDTPN